MANIGALATLLAFCLAIYAVLGSLVGRWKQKPFLAVSAERAVYSVWLLVTTASGILLYGLLNGEYGMSAVWSTSNRAMPAIYKFSAWWGGQEGSLLFWSWILSSYSAVVVFTNRHKFRSMMPYVVSILMATQAFFLMFNAFVVSPFQVFMQGLTPVDMPDGNGLNPLLQYWTMAIHPPMLYLGYVGFIVPFAFAMASLITRQPGDAWIHTTRRWTLVTWLFQTTGIILGMGWAYEVLGWGGYWAWDPVENASLLPWLTATAFLHSVIMQEKKGMMKIWNIVLIASTFFLCIFGTFLTRSGIVSSVHAFANSPVGPYFLTYLAIGIGGTVWLILDRLDYLKSETPLESVVSRESSFLFNNLFLLASCFAVLWGTLFPVISEAITNEKISVGEPFFNRVNVPIGLGLLFLTGVGPLIAWRRSSLESLKKAFLWPAVIAVVLFAGLFAAGMRNGYAMTSFALCAFVTGTIMSEFFKGSRAISTKDKIGFLPAVVELTHRNTRRYGGYIVHMGIVVMFIGFTGTAFNRNNLVEVKEGGNFQLGRYGLTLRQVQTGENDNYRWMRGVVDVAKNGEGLGTLSPETRLYKTRDQQRASEVAVRRRLNEDLYLNFAGPSNDGNAYVMQVYIFPLVSWVWIGFWVVLAGTIICLVPAKQRLQYARTQVVSQTETIGAPASHAPLER